MRIFPPSEAGQLLNTLGGLTEEELALVESRLKTEAPDVRFLHVPDESWIPWVRRFTLRVHRDDRQRASPVIDAVLRVLDPLSFRPRVLRWESALAAHLRQYVRAREAGDPVATTVARKDLFADLEWLLESLLGEEPLSRSLDIWLDGISAEWVTMTPPFGLSILGQVTCGRASDGQQGQRPFAAELATSKDAAALDHFVARFGRLDELVSEGVIKDGRPDLLLGGGDTYRIRIGVPVAYFDQPPIDWAFEVIKLSREGTSAQ
jgi:hypothetical protein